MKTLTEFNKDKETLIKLINKHRINNKNNWYQVHVKHNGYEYRMKCYDTWIQLNYIYHDNGLNFLICDDSSPMDMSVKEFKQFLSNTIK